MQFVARDKEVSALLALLDQSYAGQGSVVFVIGEPGSGKSVLLSNFLERANLHASRPRVVLARCYSGDDSTPYAPWHQITARYPAMENLLPPPLGTAAPAAQGIAELGRRVASILNGAAHEVPMVLVFEDLELADSSTLALIRTLSHRVGSTPLLLILTINAAQPHASLIADWLHTVSGESGATIMELAPVDDQAITRYVNDAFADQSPTYRQRVSQTLSQLSGGNLLVLNNLLGAFEAGEIDLTDADSLDQLPTSLSAVVSALSSRLSRGTIAVLTLAAIVGEEIDLDLLAHLNKTSALNIAEHLDAALALGLLIEDIDGTIRFRHVAFQRVLARQHPALRRRLIHAEVLEWLQRQPSSHANAIAFHADRAGKSAEAYAALLQAADEARAEFGFPEAAKLYRRALNVGERVGIADADEDRVRLAMADVLVWNDRPQGTREIDRVATRARLRGDAPMLAQSAQRRATMLYEDGDVTGCMTILREVVPILRDEHDDESLGTALSYLGYCYGSTSQFDDLAQVAEELRVLAERTGQAMYLAIALQFMASLQIARGEGGDALSLVLQSVSIAEELGRYDLATDYAAVGIMRVALIAHLHEPERVRAFAARGEELARTRSAHLLMPDMPEPAFVYARFRLGEWDCVRAVLPTLEQLIERSPQAVRDIIHNLLSELAFAEGRTTAGEIALRQVASTPESGAGDHSVQHWINAATVQAHHCIVQRDINGAAAWERAIGQVLSGREFVPGSLLHDLVHGLLAYARGESESARQIATEVARRSSAARHCIVTIHALLLASRASRGRLGSKAAIEPADDAVDLARQCRLPFEEGTALIERAQAYAVAGMSAEAVEDLRTAQEIFVRLGATASVRATESLLADVRPQRPAGLTEREVDVIQLVARGLSDRQIAEQLFISHRTVTTHVGNLLGKTMTNNRTELAIWAVRHDLDLPDGATPERAAVS
ncbi:MAG: AAA family ATPase [Thermomicrobiales bacterium]|nr:AAA family ATPase [Thermomicrobiales bacterium]